MTNRLKILLLVCFLIFFCITEPRIVIGEVARFIPTSEGEVWEETFKIPSIDEYFASMIQMRVSAVFNVTINIDNTFRSHNLTCRYTTPIPLINNQGEKSKEFVICDGQTGSFLLESAIHLEVAHISVRYNPNENDGTFPQGGFSGMIQVEVLSLGHADNSWYHTFIRLDENTSGFNFSLDTFIKRDAEIRSIGKGARVMLVLTISSNSTGIVSVNTSSIYTDFSAMTISPGSVNNQTFSLTNDMGDAIGIVTFVVTSENASAVIVGELTVFFLQEGSHTGMNFGPPTVGFVFFLLVVMLAKKIRKRKK